MSEELGPFTDGELSRWMNAHRIDTCLATYDYDGNVIRCGQRAGHFGEHADHDGWLAWSQDGSITGGTLMYGDPTTEDEGADERTLFWMNWTRQAIAWGLGLFGALIMLTMAPTGWAHIAARAGVTVAVVVLVMLVGNAVYFSIGERRGR
jgi:hypothetical protein